jgi:RNA polymerase sigma-70 factor (ECF subfamily)
MNSQTHTTLLERIRDGADAVAWDEFWTRYWRAVFNFAQCRGCSEQTAEEIVQEVMLTVFQNRQVFRYDSAKGRFRDWLGGIARNLVNKRRAKPAERVRAAGGDGQDALELAEDRHGPADDRWQQAFEESLLNVLLDLVRREVAPETYQAFELVALEGVSAADAAQITGLSRNAVYLARKRILQRLRELGESYRSEGQLLDRVKQALAAVPAAHVERSLTHWMGQSVSLRGEGSP